MGWDYVERKILEALRLAEGDQAKAAQHIIAWTFEDNKLLHELTRPHMKGIAGHAVGHVINKKKKEKVAAAQAQSSVPLDQDLTSEMGLEILKAIAGGASPRFGIENNAPRLGKKQASKAHVDAIQKMASKKSDD